MTRDSRFFESTRMSDVSYNGTALSEDGTSYYWRIRFWDDSDAQGAWSTVQQFTMNGADTTPPTPDPGRTVRA